MIVSSDRAPTPFVEQGQPVTLEVVVFKPSGPGPFPTVVFNHGSTGLGNDPSLFTVTYTHEALARFFVERGWLVAFPQRRGRGKSGGLYDEGFEPDRSRYSCRSEFSLPGVDRALADIDAAVDYLRARTDVDPRRMLSGGISRGGILAIAHAARRPDVYLGSFNFVGGWLGEACIDAAEVNRSTFVRGAFLPDRLAMALRRGRLLLHDRAQPCELRRVRGGWRPKDLQCLSASAGSGWSFHHR